MVQITLPPINKTQLDQKLTQIAIETGTNPAQYYTIEITPTFTTKANTTAGPIHQTFTPTLTITFQRTDQGETTTIEPLTQTKTENQTTIRYDILNQRYTSARATLQTETLQDLAKIAETLAKPILHTQQAEEHTFYIIDNETKYQYKTQS